MTLPPHPMPHVCESKSAIRTLPVDIVTPPFALRTNEFVEAFPLAKVPLLALDDGSTIAESTVIMDYLESLFPESALTPADPLARAHNGMLIRYTDNHLGPALSPLFKEILSPAAGKDSIAAMLDNLGEEIAKLERLLKSLPDFRSRSLQTGDICLVPNICYVVEVASWFGEQHLLDSLPTILSWRQWVNENPVVSETIDEMDRARETFFKTLQGNR